MNRHAGVRAREQLAATLFDIGPRTSGAGSTARFRAREELPMKKSGIECNHEKIPTLTLRRETLRILTARELRLVAAGNCANGSHQTQGSATNLVGIC